MNKIFFKKVKFKNFLSFGNNWQEFKYNDGINLIQGFDDTTKKSNGSGKSSFIELIPFALYGKTFKDINKNDIINWYNNSGCEVKLYFTINDDNYVFVRGIKPNKFKVYRNDEELPRLSHVRDFQAKIEEDILGFGFKTFKNLCYFSPNTTISIIEAKKEQKRQFLESLFDLSLYSDMMKSANDMLSEKKERMLVMENDLLNINTNIGVLQQSICDRAIPDTIKYEEDICDVQTRLANKENQVNSIKFDITEFDNTHEAIQCLLAEQNKIVTDKAVEKEKLQGLKKSLSNAKQKIDDIENDKTKAKEGIVRLKSEIENINIDEIESNIITYNNTLNDNMQFLDSLADSISELNTKRQVVKTKLSIQNKIIREIKSTDTLEGKKRCPTCKQDVDHSIIKSHIENEIQQHQIIVDKYSKGISVIDKLLKKYNTDFIALKKSIVEHETKITSLEKDKKQYYDIIDDIKNKTIFLDTYLNTDTLSDDIMKYNDDISINLEVFKDLLGKEADIKSSLDKTTSMYNDMLEKKRKYDLLLVDVNDLKKLLIEKKKQLVDIKKIISTIEEEHKREQQRLTVLKQEYTTKQNEITEIGIEIDHIGYIKTSLKDENIKQYAISSILPFLNKQTNYYLRSSGFPYTVEIDGWLDVKIRGVGVSNVGYGSLSGGEKKAIDMALQFSSNDISMSQAKLAFNLMLLDEVMDTSLDNVSMLLVMDIIRLRQQNTDSSIYMITHKDEIKECVFDGYINVQKSKGFSVIS